jgi:hypothetical protein
MTTSKPDVQVSKTASPAFDVVFRPDVQALIEGLASIRTSQAVSGWMIEEDLEIIAQAEEALSALSGETETEWGNEYIIGPGGFGRLDNEAVARNFAERFPQWRRLVKRQVTRTEWEVVK